MRDCPPLAHILERIATPEPSSTAKSQEKDPQCTKLSTSPAKEAPEAPPSSPGHCSDSPTGETTDSGRDPCSSSHTSLPSTPRTPSVTNTEELVDLTKRYHLPRSLLLAEPNSNPRHKFPSGVKRRAQDSFAEDPTPNVSISTREIGSSSLNEGDGRPRKKPKKSPVHTEIWVAHHLGRFERMFAGDFRMLEEMSDSSFLRHISETSDTDPALIQAVECHYIDTVSRRTTDLTMRGRFSTKEWTTRLRDSIEATSKCYAKLDKKLVRFEVILVPVLKGSREAPIML